MLSNECSFSHEVGVEEKDLLCREQWSEIDDYQTIRTIAFKINNVITDAWLTSDSNSIKKDEEV